MVDRNEKISKLKLSSQLIDKLQHNDINVINDVWTLKRKDLKNLGFADSEIKSIIISLQLEGLDLNKKVYN